MKMPIFFYLVFEGVIKDALEIIKDSNEIQENINNADQTNYDVEITKIYQVLYNCEICYIT